MNKKVERNTCIVGSFALKNDGGMPKILFLAFWGNFWQDFWQDLGKGIQGKGGGKRRDSVAKNDLGSAQNRLWDAKNLVFGRMEIFLAGFLAFVGGFWQITGVRIAEKPIKWAFVGGLGKCQKFSFWQLGRCFWHSQVNFWKITDVRLLEDL